MESSWYQAPQDSKFTHLSGELWEAAAAAREPHSSSGGHPPAVWSKPSMK